MISAFDEINFLINLPFQMIYEMYLEGKKGMQRKRTAVELIACNANMTTKQTFAWRFEWLVAQIFHRNQCVTAAQLSEQYFKPGDHFKNISCLQ